jgi:predicted Fe-Mo cluster-binding NifX family protein
MKVAVATNDQKRLTGHIGRCSSFMVFEIDDNKIISSEVRENTFTHHRMHQHHEHHGEGEGHGHNHAGLIEGLKDCTHLISSSGGWRVVEDLKQKNISTLFTDVESIEEAVNLFIKGELKNNPEMTCKHD